MSVRNEKRKSFSVYSWGVCMIAFVASAEELAIHLLRTDYRADRKSLYQK